LSKTRNLILGSLVFVSPHPPIPSGAPDPTLNEKSISLRPTRCVDRQRLWTLFEGTFRSPGKRVRSKTDLSTEKNDFSTCYLGSSRLHVIARGPPTAVVRPHICGGAHALPCTGSALPRPRLGCPELRALSPHHHVRVSGPGALRGNAFPPSGLKASCAAWRSDVRRPRVNIETGKKHRARALITRLYTGPRLRVHEDGRQQGSHTRGSRALLLAQ